MAPRAGVDTSTLHPSPYNDSIKYAVHDAKSVIPYVE